MLNSMNDITDAAVLAIIGASNTVYVPRDSINSKELESQIKAFNDTVQSFEKSLGDTVQSFEESFGDTVQSFEESFETLIALLPKVVRI